MGRGTCEKRLFANFSLLHCIALHCTVVVGRICMAAVGIAGADAAAVQCESPIANATLTNAPGDRPLCLILHFTALAPLAVAYHVSSNILPYINTYIFTNIHGCL
ncbi:unnamed protein product [Ceratitis capitata]|uniref:(Mediterranean fruit fly) hypothetical protein n=1 Tax=Ceratitis capitata TaxID=7213 RepID=A0A811UWH1_CERCA|nr:unnamed protein product [Ceratitis capitata]